MTTTSPASAPTPMTPLEKTEQRLGLILRVGVAVSATIIAVGLITSLVRHPEFLSDPEGLKRLTGPAAVFPHTISELPGQLIQLQGRAITTLGLLLLITTPVIRVCASIVMFTIERDRRFVALTVGVLLMLVISFLLGKVE
ncbi:MAG: DUF1634 domain-containing protein [Phycisphaerales bacterium]|nr:DUF1634 domain-containing protein [Phycisphaerales bacterium]MCB9863840.1 DUF1634 domain-containing protein [Phycisphaerales bacterium]